METEAFTYYWYDRGADRHYIGYHKGNPDDGYVCSSKWMLEEYTQRPDDFHRTILFAGTADDARRFEHNRLVEADAMHSPNWYNQSNGGPDFVNKRHTPEARAKISAAQKGKNAGPLSAAHRAKLSAAKKGRRRTPEARAKISAGLTGLVITPETRAKIAASRMGKPPWNRGRRLSPETRAKMSVAATGRPKSPEHRAKISAALKGRVARQRDGWHLS